METICSLWFFLIFFFSDAVLCGMIQIRQYSIYRRVPWRHPGLWGRVRLNKESHVSEAQTNMDLLSAATKLDVKQSAEVPQCLHNCWDGSLLPHCGWPHRNRLFQGETMPLAGFMLLFPFLTQVLMPYARFFFKFFEWFVSRMSHKALNPWKTRAGDPHGLFESDKGQIRWFSFSLRVALGQSGRDISLCWYSFNVP